MSRMPSPQALIFSAVGVVVFLVSVPRVHQFALQDNERDAISSILTLSSSVIAAETSAGAESLPLPATWDQEMNCRLFDAHTFSNTSLIQRHGYLLELAHRLDGSAFIRAWPSEHGATGCKAFLYDLERCLIQHSNGNAEWSGARSLRPDGTEAGWLERTSRR